ncbi:uncharacterized protein LOC111296053 isoform X1 [Durio zibethinus]|uniref:Uncharacterized protein LOC111296053 isoform X1 n=1 Tax=Durio zibethinus TaxID=66656 RepID=A0A6P5YZU1_DURZI|nr:uncharacterized protein LOC111296053 isoform X1 [Durio zibethinus]
MIVGAGIGTGIMSEIMDTMGAMREIMSAHVVMIQEVVAGHLLGLGNIPGITIGTGMIDTWKDMELMFFRSVVKSCRIGINYVPVLMLVAEFGSFYFFCWMYLLLQRLSWLIFVRDALYNQKMEQVFVKHRLHSMEGDCVCKCPSGIRMIQGRLFSFFGQASVKIALFLWFGN